MPADEVILRLENVSKYFRVGGGLLKAVENVSFSVRRGEVFGLVGESGCGKTTLGRTVIRLYEPSRGKVFYRDQDVHALSGPDLKRFNRSMQMIFQDPYASLNPRMTVGDIIAEPLDIHGLAAGAERRRRVEELLRTVGLSAEHALRFPHEFSGGQRQRIGIARALAVDPEFIVADEPISALDVSIQAQVVNLLRRLQEERGLTYMFIAHDLSMVKYLSHRVAVMYLGQVVEMAPSVELYREPLHPYTRALMSAIPIPDPGIERTRRRITLPGEVPSPLKPPPGCRFHNRCPEVRPICKETEPELKEAAPRHVVACHLY
ncbi:MAG: ABC transporter ATP-binding protein [Bacillota bacterium]|nr:ABC transporter ATP-binding protein [Bacillota bacterium]MDI7249396.1 ABC transporter ATP-binding protein [Bacillota bacterium]